MSARVTPWARAHALVLHDTSGEFSNGDITDRPCPTITVGVGSLNSRHFQVAADGLWSDPETGEDLRIPLRAAA